MLFTNHLLAGAEIGRLGSSPAVAFGAGIASHVAMDVVPHWGRWSPDELVRVGRVDGLTALALAAAALASAAPARRPAVAAAMAGAGVLDLDKPFRHFFGFSPFPASVDALHARIQVGERRSRWWIELAALAGFGLVAARRHRRT